LRFCWGIVSIFRHFSDSTVQIWTVRGDIKV
jgi:hypothetical protein